ncbi:cohesin subunit SA-1 isoform X2 [Nematostella vectensis]|uniref:cohesin subunit SA-1 isoform X2 n=1 Tax=Nematostella vectensis TaxID=45351 RepID=UPI002076E40F|nr:cohesin subunit SA-1 isoform X2 [Nematostella vectensis]
MPALKTKKADQDSGSEASSPAASDSTPVSESQKEESRRRSGRQSKQRILFGHGESPASTSSLARKPGSTKKRVTVDESGSEDEDRTGKSSDFEGSSDRSDDETPTPTPKKNTPTRGRKGTLTPKNNPFAKKPKAASTGRARGRKRKSQAADDEDQGSLFDIVKAGKGALQAVVDDWIERYNKDKEDAMVDIIHFFVQCCGCKGIVTRSMLDEDENVDAVRQLTEQFEEESHEYPLIMSGQAHKKFKANFVAFVHTLIVQCQHSIIYDEYMLDTLVSWLIRLSDSQVRAFRHTSTLAGMKLVSALIHIAKNVHVELDNTQRQLDSEIQKSSSKKAVEKIEMLQTRRQELRQNISDLEEMMNFIFQGMFVHRYRDSRPEIRALCIAEIGQWMKEYSTLFLTDRYLKYIVWNLHDKVGEVRLKSLQALQNLYDDEDLIPHLDALSSRFKDRFVAMTLDKENDVAVEAVKLTIALYDNDKLDEEDCQQIQLLVFCTHRQVAHAAGEFLAKRINDAAEADLKASKSKKGKHEKVLKVLEIKRLLDFLISSEVHNHAAYLVDSLWTSMPIIKDWRLMTEMLLDQSDKDALEDKEEDALIEIMVSSCQQAAEGLGPPGRVVRKLLSNKERRAVETEKKELSAHFMQTIPDLLSKYGTDDDKVISLVTVPQFFDLEEYGQRRLGKHLDELLTQLEDIVDKHSDAMILQECAKTFRTLTDNEYTLSTTSEVARNKVIDQFVEKFKESLVPGLDAGEDDDDNQDRFALTTALEKISAFYRAHDLGKWKLYDGLHKIMQRATAGKEMPPDRIVILAIHSMQTLLQWVLVNLDTGHPDKTQLKRLKKWTYTFLGQCEELVSFSNPDVQREAFMCLCDLYIVFAKQLCNRSALFAPLVYEPSTSFQATCRDFVVSQVFSDLDNEESEEDEDDETDAKAEEMSRKRNLLAGFCKLIIYNVFEMPLVSSVFAHLIKGFTNFGDIIKHTMSKCREISKTGFMKAVLTTLQQEFLEVKDEQEDKVDMDSPDFMAIKELAHRFALSLGVDITKAQARQALIFLHREGIKYSLSRPQGKRQSPKKAEGPPPNLAFLDILGEFSFRLIQQDKSGRNGILAFLEDQAKEKLQMTGDPWKPLITYRNSLVGHEEEDNEQQKSDKAKAPRGRGRKAAPAAVTAKTTPPTSAGRGRKRQAPATPEQEEDSSDGSENTPLARLKKTKVQSKSQEEESDTGEESGPESAPPSQQKRKKPESSQSDVDEEFESVPASSQRSWLASQQKASKRPRVSYGKKDKTNTRISVEEADIEDYESEEETPTPKAPIKVRRERRAVPEDLFGDSQDSRATDEDLDAPVL